ncbi:MAG: LPS assembly protein LptD [Pseudomonadota bacterium]
MILRLGLLFIALLGTQAAAQEAATLVADSVELTAERLLIAEGNVEILQGQTRVTAQSVTYDGESDRLILEGPIVLRDGGTTTILASQAELSQGLQDGILRGARLVLDQQLQIAAVEIQRVRGRYTQAWKVAATSCHVCDSGRPPLWQIRAKRIVHDQEEQQLYFDEAQLRILGTPVFYLPRLRLPDPTLDRATGFLAPVITQSSLLGYGVRVPYFIRLGDHADLTFAPFITTNTRTLETRYRQAFVAGEISWEVYLSNDEINADRFRWGTVGEGRFEVFNGFELNFDVEAASDRSYLSDYRYLTKDRLDSAVSLTRTRDLEDVSIELVAIRSLRDGETNSTFPSVLFDARQDYRFMPDFVGGDARLSFSFHSHYRESTSSSDEDGDGIADGLDVTRIGAQLDWDREELLAGGALLGFRAVGGFDVFAFSDDPALDDTAERGNAAAAVSLRWPLMRRAGTGALHMIEPRIQLAYSGASNADIPNEDSTRIEFDEGNLFALNRSSGFDIIEEGARADIGLTWNRTGIQGWESTMTVGRIERFSGSNDFSKSSGLSGDSSAWLISGSLTSPGPYDLIGRVLFDDDLELVKNNLRVEYEGDRFTMASSYAYLVADADEERTEAASELALNATYDFSEDFIAGLDFRYDGATETTTSAGLELTYLNECVEVAVSVSRNFTSSDTVTPSTDFNLAIGLRGFGLGSSANNRAHACR